MNRTVYSSITLAAAVFCLSLPGCSWLGVRKYWHSNIADARCDLPQNPTASEVVEHLNGNIAKVPAWRSTDVKISSRGSGMPISLKATVAVRNPRDFRMTASVASLVNELDMGSNGDRLWFWVRTGERAVFTARYNDLHRVQVQLPFHPDWVIEALGVVPIDESEVEFQISEGDPNVAFLSRQRKALNGAPVRMVTTVNLYRGVITGHDLRGPNNELIARARLSEHKLDSASGALIPHKIELEWPHDGMSVALALGNVEVNPPALSAQLFQMPPIDGCPPVDLARLNFGPRGQAQAPPASRRPGRRPERRRPSADDVDEEPAADATAGSARLDDDSDEALR